MMNLTSDLRNGLARHRRLSSRALGSIPHRDLECFLCPKIFLYFLAELKIYHPSYSICIENDYFKKRGMRDDDHGAPEHS